MADGDRLLAVEFRREPRERANEGFEFVGTLSRIFGRYYASHTLKDRDIVQLHAPLRPDWLAPLIDTGHPSKALPLWRFALRPNFDQSGEV